MENKSFFFAGGGTGGHIYPAIAVAQQLIKLEPNAKIHFFCSSRDIDEKILKQTAFEYTKLPTRGFSLCPAEFINFCTTFFKSSQIAKDIITNTSNSVVIGTGGFVAAPVCWTAYKNNIPVNLINVDIIPGKANKLIGRFSKQIFLQFDDTKKYFAKNKAKIDVTGCPLRDGFNNPNPDKAIEKLSLNKQKKILLVTGASSGSQNINESVCLLLKQLEAFSDNWQIVHITGTSNLQKITELYTSVKISHKVIGYYDDMPDLLAAADLLIGRSGAVSIAEYAAAMTPSICMPYPYHKDRHQYFNAEKLVEAGAAIIVDDLPNAKERTDWLAEELLPLLNDNEKRKNMAQVCTSIFKKDAAKIIAQQLLRI